MAKIIFAMLVLLMPLLSQPANAVRYDRQCDGMSPVLFQKKLKDLAHDLRQEMATESPPVNDEALARRAECDVETGKAPTTGGQSAPAPEEQNATSLSGC